MLMTGVKNKLQELRGEWGSDIVEEKKVYKKTHLLLWPTQGEFLK